MAYFDPELMRLLIGGGAIAMIGVLVVWRTLSAMKRHRREIDRRRERELRTRGA